MIRTYKNQWSYSSPTDQPGVFIIYVYTEAAILREYWVDWSSEMIELEREDQISEQNCISDWVQKHWAVPYNDEDED
jgi:hypothetical protein